MSAASSFTTSHHQQQQQQQQQEMMERLVLVLAVLATLVLVAVSAEDEEVGLKAPSQNHPKSMSAQTDTAIASKLVARGCPSARAAGTLVGQKESLAEIFHNPPTHPPRQDRYWRIKRPDSADDRRLSMEDRG